jgi:glyoxylase-like metal-dependent hydrolase (beta-lactamase superfamily II)
LKIIDGIYQLEIPMEHNPLGKTFSYLFEEEKTLIDTGVPTDSAYRGFQKQLKEHNIQPSEIKKVILTHLHNDHIGLAKNLQSHGTKLLASRIASENQVKIQNEYKNLYELTVEETKLFGGSQYLNFLARFVYAFRDVPNPIRIDRTLNDGETIKLDGIELKVIWTPGHAKEHIVLYDKNDRLLFSGDHVLPKITSHIALHSYEKHDPLAEYLNSLEKVKNLEVNLVLPGHEWSFTNLSERVDQLKKHHQNRLQEIKGTLVDGPKTVYQVGSMVKWESRPWPEMSFWTKRMAATETYAHLIYLRNRGDLSEENKEGVLFF